MIRSILDRMSLKSRSHRQHSRRRHGRRLGGLEGLEGRLLLASDPTIYTVNLTSATGVGTGDTGDLVYVIELANANANTAGSVIQFDPVVFATPETIILTSTLVLSESAGPEVIDGPGASLATVSGHGAVGVFSVAAGVTASISGVNITAGSTILDGGGIDNSGTLTVSGCTLSDNAASDSGGGIENESGGTLTITQSIFTNNTATDGGGIDNDGTLTLTADTFGGNSATFFGGGVENDADGNVNDTLSTYTTNNAGANGGGIDNFGSATLTNDTLSGNTATTGGGGIINDPDADLKIVDTTIANNTANGGAGIANLGTATLTDSTVADNTANVDGGGLANIGTTVALTACTVSGNVAADGGGLYNSSPDVLATLTDTIVAANTEPSGTPDDINGSGAGDVTGSYNLIGTGGSGGITNGEDKNIVLTSLADLGLAPLNGYGGPTETIALMPSSAAIGAGTAVPGITTDQRGFPLASPVDIGAFQTQALPLVVNTTVDGVGSPVATMSLRDAVNVANLLTADATITFDPTVFSTPQTITLIGGTLVLSNTQTPETIDGPVTGGVTISGDNAVGVFQVNSGVTATLADLTISGGSANIGAGIASQGTLTITSDNFTGNAAIYYGGAIYNNSGMLTVSDSTFSDNTATYGLGGAIDNSGVLTVSDSTFTGGAAFQGGAIDNKSGTLTVTNSTLDSNTGTEGGGIFNNAMATITGSTISNDSTSFDGGGIANDLSGVMTITNSTIAFNHAGQAGGGIDQAGGGLGLGGTLTVINSTIAYNTVNSGGSGGGILAALGTTNLYNTIVALNTVVTTTIPVTASASDIAGTVAQTSVFNLIGTGGSGGLTSTATNGNLINVSSPGLASALANNGGPTQTIAVLAGSPAIGAGSSSITGITVPITDQRGVARPTSSITIGAFQYVPVIVISPPIVPVVPITITGPIIIAAVPITVVTSNAIVAVPMAVSAGPAQNAVSVNTKGLDGGSSTKFHRTKRTATLTRSVAVFAKHAKASVKQAKGTAKKK